MADILSQDQVAEYLAFLQLTHDEADAVRRPSLANLEILMVRHLACAPFNNIEIHYSPAHTVTIDIPSIYDKVVRRRRGGYCMELNTLFSHLLATLGYTAWLAPARVSRDRTGPAEAHTRSFHGITHCVVLVEFVDLDTGGPKTYLADIAFGGPGIVAPLELYEGASIAGIPGEAHRVVKVAVPETRRKAPYWLLQHYHRGYGQGEGSETPWMDLYMILEQEMTIRDCVVSSHWSSTREPIFMENLLAARLVRDGNAPRGKYTLFNNTIKKRLGQENVEDETLASEGERVQALGRYFGIELNANESSAIRGRETELLCMS
ncbi:hypothetical protein DRE_06759 [Drechslerella stenobrocha 248]|uniref:Uncharacterized protein n=1 Tax=Drechslerella stenobrocha 248 TaxID=1043628 RepID=W7HKG3_9PEZI|nr:hypothetical protein DRE_06759 [Drechslerella stenobrocha 248]